MSQWTAPSGHKRCLRGFGRLDSEESAWCFPPNTAAPPGVAQMCSVSRGNLISNEPLPHTSSKRGLYTAVRKPKRDAGSVRETHFLSVDGRTLCLFGVGNP